jgi:hypothetical protein
MGTVESGQINQQQVPKYFPTPVDDLRCLMEHFLKKDDTKYQYREALTSNICYNLQHLEYLDFLVSDKNKYLRLTNVLKKQTIKSIVVITVGIIEGILYYLILTRGKPATTQWKSCMKIQNTKKHSEKEYMIKNEILVRENDKWKSVMSVSGTKKHSNGKHYKIESEIFVKLEKAIQTDMSLNQMIEKVRNKNLLGEDKEIYDDINELRTSRNKVHIRIIKERTDTDWKSFDEKLLRLSKKVLSNVLKEVGIFTDEQLSQEAFSYLDN